MAMSLGDVMEAAGLPLGCEWCGVDLDDSTVLFADDPALPLCYPCCEELYPKVFKAAMARLATIAPEISDLPAGEVPRLGATEIDPAALAQVDALLDDWSDSEDLEELTADPDAEIQVAPPPPRNQIHVEVPGLHAPAGDWSDTGL